MGTKAARTARHTPLCRLDGEQVSGAAGGQAKLEAAEKAIGTLQRHLRQGHQCTDHAPGQAEAAGITDVTVSMKGRRLTAAITTWASRPTAPSSISGTKGQHHGLRHRAAYAVLTCKTYTKESTGCLFSIPLDEERLELRTVAARHQCAWRRWRVPPILPACPEVSPEGQRGREQGGLQQRYRIRSCGPPPRGPPATPA